MIKLFLIISYIFIGFVVGGFVYNWFENEDGEDPKGNSMAAFIIGMGWSVILPIFILVNIVVFCGKLCAWMGGFIKGVKRK